MTESNLGNDQHQKHVFWLCDQDPVDCLYREAVDFLANTFIFLVSGLIIASRIYDGHQRGSPHVLTGKDYAWAVVLWLLLLVGVFSLDKHLAILPKHFIEM